MKKQWTFKCLKPDNKHGTNKFRETHIGTQTARLRLVTTVWSIYTQRVVWFRLVLRLRLDFGLVLGLGLGLGLASLVQALSQGPQGPEIKGWAKG